MEIINYDRYGETIFKETLDNGLEVHIIEKPEYIKSNVSITAKYGSLDLYQSEDEMTLTGIAHYLEHMLFNTSEGDASEDFIKYGASINAFTSINQTSYYFQTTDNILLLTEKLLNFVHFPSFTDELVEKERGIIVEELKMYLDRPTLKLVNIANDNLYLNHPSKYDIGGSVEDVLKITKEDLEKIYSKYYVPSNMIFFYIGPLKHQEVLKFLKEFYQNKQVVVKKAPTKYFPVVEKEIKEVHSFINEERAIAKNAIAYKILTDIEKNRLRLLITIYLSLSISETSDLYEKMINEKIINNNFSYNVLCLDDMTTVIVSADTNNYEEFFSLITNTLSNYQVNEEDFKKFKIKFYGSTMSMLNSLDNIMYEYVSSLIDDTDIFALTDLVSDLSYDEILKVSELFSSNYTKVTIK